MKPKDAPKNNAILCPDCGDVLVNKYNMDGSSTLYCRKCEITFYISKDSFGKIKDTTANEPNL